MDSKGADMEGKMFGRQCQIAMYDDYDVHPHMIYDSFSFFNLSSKRSLKRNKFRYLHLSCTDCASEA